MGKNTKDHINKTMDEVVSKKTNVPSPAEAINKLKVDIQMAFIDADAFTADPYALLGQVIQIRKKDGKCPANLSDPNFSAELIAFPVPHKVNDASKLSKPQLRSSIIVDQQLASSVSFLSYLSAELKADTSFSLIVIDQATGLIDMTDKDWRTNVAEWKKDNKDIMDDPEICYLFVVAGFVQKNIIRKKYIKFSGKTKGGAFGVNLNGELATGTEDYSLDIKFGLTPIILKRPGAPAPAPNALGMGKLPASVKPTKAEQSLFRSMSGAYLAGKKIKRKGKK